MKVKGKQVFGAQGKKRSQEKQNCTAAMVYLHFTNLFLQKKSLLAHVHFQKQKPQSLSSDPTCIQITSYLRRCKRHQTWNHKHHLHLPARPICRHQGTLAIYLGNCLSVPSPPRQLFKSYNNHHQNCKHTVS